MRKVKLNEKERQIDDALLKGEFRDVDQKMFKEIADSIASRRKDAVLNVRVNSQDLIRIKTKASRLGVKYQTLISELIHRAAV